MLLPRMFASFAVASALLLVTPSLSAQVSAPTQDEGGGIAPPGGGGNTSGSGTVISGGGALPTPSGASIDMAPPMTLEPTPSSSGGLASLRGDQALTASALMGSVNGQPIFVQDVLAPIDQPLRRLAQSVRTLGEFRDGARRLIDTQLRTLEYEIFVVSAAESSMSEHDREVVNQVVRQRENELRTSHGGSIPAADKALRAQGSSYQRTVADIRRQTIVTLYRQKTVLPRLVVTREMVVAAYQRDPKVWQEEPQVELYSMRIRISRWLPRAQTTDGTVGRLVTNPSPEQIASAEKQAIATARDLITKLQATPVEKRGAEFARMVEDYGVNDTGSDNTYNRGGRTPDVKPGTFQNQDLEKLIFSLPANTLGEPLLVREASPVNSVVYIVMVGDKKEARTIPFSEAQTKIYSDLRDTQAKELWNVLMEKLFNPNAVEAVERMREVAVEAAVARYAIK